MANSHRDCEVEFERTPDGGVCIKRLSSREPDANIVSAVYVSNLSWCNIVAAVSKRGAMNPGSWTAANHFHNREE